MAESLSDKIKKIISCFGRAETKFSSIYTHGDLEIRRDSLLNICQVFYKNRLAYFKSNLREDFCQDEAYHQRDWESQLNKLYEKSKETPKP